MFFVNLIKDVSVVNEVRVLFKRNNLIEKGSYKWGTKVRRLDSGRIQRNEWTGMYIKARRKGLTETIGDIKSRTEFKMLKVKVFNVTNFLSTVGNSPLKGGDVEFQKDININNARLEHNFNNIKVQHEPLNINLNSAHELIQYKYMLILLPR